MFAANNQQRNTDNDAAAGNSRGRLVVIAGPTAVGKTALGITLSQEFSGEVVNADSRYLYQGFDIGVAKPDVRERAGIPHHLIDILPPDADMSLARFQDMALAAIKDIHSRGALPLLVGGTPLYINAVVEGWRIPRVSPNPGLRSALEAEANEIGIQAMSERLRAVDRDSAERCGANLRRIIRALEVFDATGIPMSAQEGKGPPPFDSLEIALTLPRNALYRAIDARVEYQVARGLVDEVRDLLRKGVRADAPAMSSIGYRQLLPYIRGESSLADAVERIKADTHRYVRHQETWLRRNPRLTWIDTTRPGWQLEATIVVREFLARPGIE